MRVYHFVNAGYGLQNIQRRRLKIATIEDLNDPFELRAMVLSTAHKRWAIGEWRRDIASKVGLLCFSTSWRNPVQWSHYAHHHTGLCLGFDIPEKFLMPVTYQAKLHPDLITPALNRAEMGEGAVLKLLSTKYSHWRYEREIRMFMDLEVAQTEGALYFHPFDDEMRLTEVIIGAQCTIKRAALADALGDLAGEVATEKARLAFRSFNVIRQRKADLWD
ncbi:DUF2971 domain-containing protein [Phenylobacterium sp.]|uniref:DUF2971 domain-containing protein n=1 Tax=Phenylobacterium sp. TaxID=1871053 RepID=UPI0027286F7B|nr:DUF2971 domain-containing protein [Phenylobacterium sp.]MDO8800990.1 DUF2971 domain-containing protein [Phenylobacterium sp.]